MLSSITDDQGRRVDYWIDESGRPYLVRCNQAFDASLNPVTYQQTAYTYDNSTSNNPSAWLTRLSNTWNYKNQYNQWLQTTLVQNDYTMNNGGQRLTNAITSSAGTRTEQYGYDELNRLKTVDYGDGQTQGYSFDAMGNRTQKTDTVNGTEGYTFNAANMLLSRAANTYTNDADGNTLSGGGRTNTWDSQNRLASCVNGANTSTFVYGADGIRKQSTVNGTTTDFVLDASMFIRERRAGSNIATYLVGGRGPEYRRDDVSGNVRWYLYDGLGSVLGEVDPNGSITSSRKYDVYGLVREGVNPGGTSKHKFVGALGHPSEDETGLIYMQARYYEPMLGRFMSEDCKGDHQNWFVYCSNNPINKLDPGGCSDAPDTNIWTQLFATARTEWRFALMESPQFRLVALEFLALWFAMFANEAFNGNLGLTMDTGLRLESLSRDYAGTLGKAPRSAMTIGEQIEGFYAGWAAGEEITFLFLFREDYYGGE